jgi:hypothetical protein
MGIAPTDLYEKLRKYLSERAEYERKHLLYELVIRRYI